MSSTCRTSLKASPPMKACASWRVAWNSATDSRRRLSITSTAGTYTLLIRSVNARRRSRLTFEKAATSHGGEITSRSVCTSRDSSRSRIHADSSHTALTTAKTLGFARKSALCIAARASVKGWARGPITMVPSSGGGVDDFERNPTDEIAPRNSSERIE
eukprot:1535285-Pleurochrysis_carterae.AAC.2